MSWVQWRVSEDKTELIAPCGHRVPNSGLGVVEAMDHACQTTLDLDDVL